MSNSGGFVTQKLKLILKIFDDIFFWSMKICKLCNNNFCFKTLIHLYSDYFLPCNLFETSKNETTNSPVHQFTCCIKAREPFKILFNGVLFLIHYFKKHFKPCFFNLKALKDILQHFKFVNWRIRGFVFLMSRTG